MRRLIAFAFAAAVFAAPATQAGAATAPTAAQFKALQKQVATLQKQVKKLQKDVKETDELATVSLLYGVCASANAADALQGTWQAIDQREQAQGRAVVFGPQAPINDGNVCRSAGVTRSHSVPPGVASFSALNFAIGIRSFRFTALNLLVP